MEHRNIIIISSDGKLRRGSAPAKSTTRVPIASVPPNNVQSKFITKPRKIYLPPCHDYTEKGDSDDEGTFQPKKRVHLGHLTDREKHETENEKQGICTDSEEENVARHVGTTSYIS